MPVLLPLGLPGAYDYLVPEGETVGPGQFVVVPLGPSEYIGAVWRHEEGAEPPKIAAKKLRAIAEILHDVPKLPPVSLDFADWVANYTLALPGMVLRMMMSAKAAFQPPAPRYGVRLVGEAPERIVARQHAETGEFEGRGPVIRTRPLCPYPQRAEYLGEGSPDLADSFRCVTADKGSH